ncbi:bleomycin resistance protein [Hahella sp. CCB-MM4]|uniref:AAA family ATPase n=1 Tax=Hahella sp. (strain CCB-MM4) TaxID=1926491 RepID=UPI000B9BF621|nr:AAA family ATPase [Hahella sp. CCB-MM4]OZG72453.1 bleomycin resistance protein [Hahella sp. CCB-MM4]
MAIIHLVEGPVGAGKSTYASQLGQEYRAPVLNLDDWMVTLFSPDRPMENAIEWYIERKERCIEQIWKVTSEIISSGNDVILELGLIQQASRQKFFDKVEFARYMMRIYVLDAPREIRRMRVQRRNREQGTTYSMAVPDHVFEMASNLWEPVEQLECNGYEVKYISTV